MTTVFVHGVPETSAIWEGVRSRIDRESIAVALPGFGNDRPKGFGATKDDYARWLADELAALAEPVDLVGHDWGALLTVRIATAHGGLLRSWVADVANVFHPDYVWHEFAQIWQTPGQGEEFMDTQLALDVDTGAQIYAGFDVPADEAKKLVAAVDHTMTRCILDLYRSAVPNCSADWGADVAPTAAPGMLLAATNDPFGNEHLAADMAARLGARTAPLDGLGHWWMLQDPARGAQALTEFWNTLG